CKLNMKAAAYGSPVEWHQDFAFYPRTNDSLLAVGFALDDCTLENGCMLMLPGSHRGPLLDHHQEGVFAGAVDTRREGIALEAAVPVPAGAGGLTLHHCRTLHASAPNHSARPRRLFLVQYTAVDAWPLAGVPDLAAWDAKIVRGEPTRVYRMMELAVRVPLP
ncbi:MAG: phytanoyl-CoA dioxygenase, partial [Chloroflexota bacterium]